MGAVSETKWLVSDHLPSTASPARVKPRKVLPASPKNRLADFPNLKLWGMNPRHDPAIATENQPRAGWFVLKAIIPKKVEIIMEIPAAKPSIPSKKFMALVRPTNHKAVSGILIMQNKQVRVTLNPVNKQLRLSNSIPAETNTHITIRFTFCSQIICGDNCSCGRRQQDD